MKNVITLITVATLTLCLVGCGKSEEEKKKEAQAQAQTADAKLWGGMKREEPPKPRPASPKNF